MSTLSPEALYGLLLVGLFVGARILVLARLPAAITCLLFGALMGMGFGRFEGDATITLLAMLGIVTLFLHAGLDVDLEALRGQAAPLAGHLALQIVLLCAGTVAAALVFGLTTRAAFLVALALLTSSTGFILDTLPGFALSEEERAWVRTKAIAGEILALVALFYAVQSTSVLGFVAASVALVLMIFALPPVFGFFARHVLPRSPKSEFTFLVLLAFVCAFFTRALGVYYLVGAFAVGVAATRMRDRAPALTSESVRGAVELFASFFVPFYFFEAGLGFEAEDFTFLSLGIGFAMLLTVPPLRLAATIAHRRVALGEPAGRSARVGLALLPTLVFTLVIADILRAQYALPRELHGGLVVYTIVCTTLPGLFLLRGPARARPTGPVPTPEPPPATTPPVTEAHVASTGAGAEPS